MFVLIEVTVAVAWVFLELVEGNEDGRVTADAEQPAVTVMVLAGIRVELLTTTVLTKVLGGGQTNGQ